jgi:hypothetical protein
MQTSLVQITLCAPINKEAVEVYQKKHEGVEAEKKNKEGEERKGEEEERVADV